MKKQELLNVCREMNLKMGDKILLNGMEAKLTGYRMDRDSKYDNNCSLHVNIKRKGYDFNASEIESLECLVDTSKRRKNDWLIIPDFE